MLQRSWVLVRPRTGETRRSWRRFAAGIGLLLALGAAAVEPPGAVPEGKARLYVYREAQPYGSPLWTRVWLDHQPLGDSAPGVVFTRDVVPGTYEVEVNSDKLYPDQFKTIAVTPGSATFIKIEEVIGWGQSARAWRGTTFVVVIMDPAVARQQIARLRASEG